MTFAVAKRQARGRSKSTAGLVLEHAHEKIMKSSSLI